MAEWLRYRTANPNISVRFQLWPYTLLKIKKSICYTNIINKEGEHIMNNLHTTLFGFNDLNDSQCESVSTCSPICI